MDELSSNFGRLSTSAAEWKPGATSDSNSSNSKSKSSSYPVQQQQQQQKLSKEVDSDLRASSVTEFVPGRGWAATKNVPVPSHTNGTAIGGEATTNDGGAGDADEASSFGLPSTIPAGPVPAPLPSFRALHSLGVSDDAWRHYRDLSVANMRQMDPSDSRHKAIPTPYCNAYCLDDDNNNDDNNAALAGNNNNSSTRSSFGYPSGTFLVTSREDGNLYCLRRFDNVRCVSPKIAAAVLERWTTPPAVQEHPGVVPLLNCFCAQRAVFFVHAYVPGAQSLHKRVLRGGAPLSEAVLWSCIAQLVSAVRTLHAAGLAAQTLDARHVLSTTDPTNSRLRLRLSGAGMVDALEFEARRHVTDLQRQDVIDLGWLLLSLASCTPLRKNNNRNSNSQSNNDPETVSRCEAFVSQHYSRELHNLIVTLMRSARQPPTIHDVSRAIAQRVLDEQDAAYRTVDLHDRWLAAEYQSGRAFRLMLKLGFINERPELGPNRRWSQSGDCYVLTLFRDYVFHQADGAGRPVMDIGHVVTALHKLDAHDEERIVLASRDGKSLMVVSYADVARCLEHAYAELCQSSVVVLPPSPHGRGAPHQHHGPY